MVPRKCRTILEYMLVAYCFGMMLAVISIRNEVNIQKAEQQAAEINFSRLTKTERKESDKPSHRVYIPLNASYKASRFRVNDQQNASSFKVPDDFPLANGLMRPRPQLRVGNAMQNATFVIGVPSIKREDHDYLTSSIRSLLENLSPLEMESTAIVVFLGEENEENYLNDRMNALSNMFKKEIANRNLEIIAPPPSFYPSNWVEVIKPRFGDDFPRSKWRSKQNLDQIFLMMYVYHLNPDYYLMMEDDVVAAKGYFQHMKKAIEDRKRLKWFYVSFCSLGAIGKLFEKSILPSYASFIHTFWNIKPLDWIQTDFAKSKVCSYDEDQEKCDRRIRMITPKYHPSLFQHVGKTSSLKGKIQNLADPRFKLNPQLQPLNPK